MSNSNSVEGEPQSSAYNRIMSSITKFVESKEATEEFSRELLWALRDEQKRCQAKMSRCLILGIGAALLFELLNRKLIAEISFSTIKLSRLDFLRLILPVAFAFETMRYFIATTEEMFFRRLRNGFVELRFPSLDKSGIDLAMQSELLPLAPILPSEYTSSRLQTIEALVGFTQVTLMLAAPIAFLVYAYVQLFGSLPIGDFGLWLSLAVTIILMVPGYSYLVVGYSENET